MVKKERRTWTVTVELESWIGSPKLDARLTLGHVNHRGDSRRMGERVNGATRPGRMTGDARREISDEKGLLQWITAGGINETKCDGGEVLSLRLLLKRRDVRSVLA